MQQEISEPEVRRITRALTKRWGHRLRDERFRVSGWLDRTEVQVAIVLHNSDDSFHYRLEARVDLKATPLEPIEARDLALDFLDWYLGEYLDAGRDLFLPLDWEPYSFGEHEVQARGEIRNLKLEAQADDLLAGRVRAEDLGRPSAGSEESEDPAEPGGDA